MKYLRPGHAPDLLRKLRRGHWPIRDEFDLHGLNRHEAAALASRFLDESAGLRCVRLIPGKGEVLREVLRALLPGRADVLAVVEAPPGEGGSGAFLVLLKS